MQTALWKSHEAIAMIIRAAANSALLSRATIVSQQTQIMFCCFNMTAHVDLMIESSTCTNGRLHRFSICRDFRNSQILCLPYKTCVKRCSIQNIKSQVGSDHLSMQPSILPHSSKQTGYKRPRPPDAGYWHWYSEASYLYICIYVYIEFLSQWLVAIERSSLL